MEPTIHPLVHDALNQGVPIRTIELLLALPVVVTLIAFFRQVVGIKAFGIYTPSLITFAFLVIEMESDVPYGGLKYGIPVYIIVVVVGMAMRHLLKHFRLLHLPRVAIMLTVISFVMMAILYLGATDLRTGFAALSPLSLIVMIILVEKFIATQIEKDTNTAVVVASQTLLISIFTFFIVNWDFMRELFLKHPWVVLLTIPINIFLGKWIGLRLSEYYRFHSLLKK